MPSPADTSRCGAPLEDIAMRSIALFCSLLLCLVAGCAHAPAAADALARSLADPARSAADRERDGRDQAAAVLAFAGFERGDRIADIFGGGGYYSEILAGVVGSEGRVLLINNPPYHEYAKKDLEPRIAGGRLKNVDYSVTAPDAMQLPAGGLDGALIVMSYHDLYYADPAQGWPAIDAGQFIDQIVTALKPGGVLLIVDHAAKDGSGKADAQTLHRIDEQFAIADFKAHGLVFDGALDVLRSTDDDRSRNVFDAVIKGRTDRFVHRYRKP
jgi:predicted methyltransferase